MEGLDYCLKCGSSHDDDCSTEAVYFHWLPDSHYTVPQEVFILGDWSQWQRKEKMGRVSPSKGVAYFSLLLALS